LRRSERSLLAKTLQPKYGDFESAPTVEESLINYRAELLRERAVVFPDY